MKSFVTFTPLTKRLAIFIFSISSAAFSEVKLAPGQALSLTEMPSNSGRKPNIIFIFADDWGYGDLGIHGSSFVETPNLDAMAAEGIDFQNFTVNSPVCSPSRTAVMTGQFPAQNNIHQHFAGANLNKARGMPDWLDPSVPMLPRLLQDAGYKTAHFGKWHLGAASDAPTEDEYGYDEFATFNGSGVNEIDVPSLSSVHHVEDFIRRHTNESFFINLWLHETHLPHIPLEEYMQQFSDLEERQQVYASVIAEGDAAVGNVLNLLKELNIDEQTLVVFSSDNGPEFAKDETARRHNGSKDGLGGYFSVGETGDLKGEKRSLFAGGTRVPFIVRWPGVAPAGQTDRTSVMTAVDLLPTFLDIAGISMPKDFVPDGESVLSAFQGQEFARTKPIFWEWRGPKVREYTWPDLSVRDGRWKLIMNSEQKKIELYDLNTDWEEQHNVADDHPELAQELSRKLIDWKASLPTAPKVHTLSEQRK